MLRLGFRVPKKTKNEKEIRSIAENYLIAFVDYRFEDAKKFGDKSAARFLDEVQQAINTWTPTKREQARKENASVKVKINEIEIKNTDKAEAKYELVKDNQALQSDILYLSKQGKTWKVREFVR